MSLMDYVKVVPQYILPKHILSSGMHWFMQIKQPWIKNQTIKALSKIYKIDLADAVQPDIEFYRDFNQFFTRALKPDARPIYEGEDVWVSPADGVISQSTSIDGNRMIQAKCHDYTIEALVGGDIHYAEQFKNGDFAVIYLSPRDYHRVHMPISGKLMSMTYVPGDLFAVNPSTVKLVPGLLARNERLVLRFESQQGPFCLVMVGAIFVGSMETVFQGKITPPYAPTLQHWDYHHEPHYFAKGDEIGRFNMGSTVVLVTPENQFPALGEQTERFVKMGEAFEFPNEPEPETDYTDNNEDELDEHATGGY